MSVTKELLPRVNCPTLVFQSRDDHVVIPDNAPFIIEKIGTKNKRLFWLENSYHVATLDNDKELIARETLKFIQNTLSQGGKFLNIPPNKNKTGFLTWWLKLKRFSDQDAGELGIIIYDDKKE